MGKFPGLNNKLSRAAAAFLSVILAAGCAPTYPRERLIESISEISKKEYNAEVQAKISGKTLTVFLPLEELFDPNLEIFPSAVEKIEAVIAGTSRVIFSTDAEIDFYVIIAADVKNTAAEFVLTRYVPDVYKMIHNWITREEFRRRMLWQINVNPRNLTQQRDDFTAENITVPVFLTQQLLQRMNLHKKYPAAYGVRLKGDYDEPTRQFTFSLVAADKKMFQEFLAPMILRETAEVFQYYRYEDFDRVKIVNVLTQESVIAGREELNSFREPASAGKKPPAVVSFN